MLLLRERTSTLALLLRAGASESDCRTRVHASTVYLIGARPAALQAADRSDDR